MPQPGFQVAPGLGQGNAGFGDFHLDVVADVEIGVGRPAHHVGEAGEVASLGRRQGPDPVRAVPDRGRVAPVAAEVTGTPLDVGSALR